MSPDEHDNAVLYFQKLSDQLLEAAMNSDYKTVSLILLRGGVDPNVVDEDRNSPLLLAADKSDYETIARLLIPSWHQLRCNRLNIDHANSQGDTAMHIAARRGDSRILNLLVSYGANPAVLNASGLTPSEVAIHNKHFVLGEELIRIEKRCRNDHWNSR